MKINWHRIKYIKGALPYIHRTVVPFIFVVDYARLWFKRYLLKGKSPDRKFIVINLIEHFGDIVACEPVARYARKKYPDAYIIWMVRKSYLELVENTPAIDESFTILCLTEWVLLSKTKLFDEIIDLHLQDRVCPVCSRPLLKAAGNTDITIENYYKYGNLLAICCQSSGLPLIEESPRVYITEKAVRRVDELNLPNNFIVIHTISNEKIRDWKSEKWEELADKIISTLEIPLIEIGIRNSLHLKSSFYLNLCGELSILESAEVIRRAELFIGIDSGPAHLANATGTFGIILLGDYRIFKHYMPYSGAYMNGKNARIIRQDGPVAEISVDSVYNAIVQCMACKGAT